MHAQQRRFIEFSLECNVLRFGDFTLKSGRKSPYFFNAGLFNTGRRLDLLGSYYADTLMAAGIEFDMLYGAAYKGIPLVSATAMALARGHDLDIGWSFNRKEAKDHGEKGSLVGAELSGRVVMIDDVVSAGTSLRESVQIISGAGAVAAAVLVALDRQERGEGDRSALAEARDRLGLKTLAIVSLDDLMSFLELTAAGSAELRRMREYRERYGA